MLVCCWIEVFDLQTKVLTTTRYFVTTSEWPVFCGNIGVTGILWQHRSDRWWKKYMIFSNSDSAVNRITKSSSQSNAISFLQKQFISTSFYLVLFLNHSPYLNPWPLADSLQSSHYINPFVRNAFFLYPAET